MIEWHCIYYDANFKTKVKYNASDNNDKCNKNVKIKKKLIIFDQLTMYHY